MTFHKPIQLDLDRIRTLALQMWVRAESMVAQAVRSVVERDPHLGRAVVAADRELDELEIEIDQRCLRCLALRQPVGSDLRFVTTVMKMVTDIERIGDLAVNICERGLDLFSEAGPDAPDELVRMGELVVGMVRRAADAFVAADATAARSLRSADGEIDRLNQLVFQRWAAEMTQHPDQVDRALAFTSISRYLERVGDHAVSLGQHVVFLVEGQDVRHRRD